MIRLSLVLVFVVALGATGCSSNCDNAGVTVDGNGNIIVRGESGFISPNSSILKNVSSWPGPPKGEQNFAFSQGYTLSRDGTKFYLLANTATHPNLVYQIDLSTGRSAFLGRHARNVAAEIAATGDDGGMAASKETWIASDGRYVYSVDQQHAVISRGALAKNTDLSPFITGSRTQLHSPIGVALGRDGELCALDGETLFVLCYAPTARGNVSPEKKVDTKGLLGWKQVDAIAFGEPGELAVAGTSDPNGREGFSIAVFAVSSGAPHLLRTIGGTQTKLGFPESIVFDRLGNILILQNATTSDAASEIVAFGAGQHGNVAPSAIADTGRVGSNWFRMAIDPETGDVAILGADGVAYFPKAANHAPSHWPAEERLSARGWDVAFGGTSFIVANEFGTPIAHSRSQIFKESSLRESGILNLHDPEFISTDQAGGIYVVSTDGIITRLPEDFRRVRNTAAISFRTTFERNMSAFAVDSAGYYYPSSTSNNAIIVVGQNGRQSIIRGSSTSLNHPMGLAVAQDGTLFVANSDGKNILEFARGASGDTAPIGRIEGASTRLIAPQSLAIDSTGRLYVFDGPIATSGSSERHFVRVFDVRNRGNAMPLESYPVQTTCWVNAP